MMIAYAHGAHDYPGYPGQLAQSNVIMEDSMMPVKAFYFLLECPVLYYIHNFAAFSSLVSIDKKKMKICFTI